MPSCRHEGIRTLIQGQIDHLTPAGIVTGWVRDARSQLACLVQIRLAGAVLAEAVADLFRPDLLRAGQGHGHYGFRAQLRQALPPGPCRVELHLPETGTTAPMPLRVPPPLPAGPVRVEALLARPDGWSTQDLLDHPACLDMAASHAALGTPRFVDAVFRFVFARWPIAAEARMNTESLAAGRITPAGLLAECLSSRERAGMPPGLPHPFAADFAFLTPSSPQGRAP